MQLIIVMAVFSLANLAGFSMVTEPVDSAPGPAHTQAANTQEPRNMVDAIKAHRQAD